jgi:hypothetical protein
MKNMMAVVKSIFSFLIKITKACLQFAGRCLKFSNRVDQKQTFEVYEAVIVF